MQWRFEADCIHVSAPWLDTLGLADMAGRRIPKSRRELVSAFVGESVGMVVKMLGDSPIAYFHHAREPFDSTTKIDHGL